MASWRFLWTFATFFFQEKAALCFRKTFFWHNCVQQYQRARGTSSSTLAVIIRTFRLSLPFCRAFVSTLCLRVPIRLLTRHSPFKLRIYTRIINRIINSSYSNEFVNRLIVTPSIFKLIIIRSCTIISKIYSIQYIGFERKSTFNESFFHCVEHLLHVRVAHDDL